MICRERAVKGLDAERRRVAREPAGIHQCHRSKPTNVAVVQRSTIVEDELDRRVLALAFWKMAGVNQQGAREARLDDKALASREVEDDELRAPPRSGDPRADDALRQRPSADFTQHVGAVYMNRDNGSSCDLAIEVAGDGLGLRKLRHPLSLRRGAPARATRCRCGTACPRTESPRRAPGSCRAPFRPSLQGRSPRAHARPR